MNFAETMKETPVIAILRGITPAEVINVCDVLYAKNIKLLEITLNTPNALESIAIAAKHCQGRQKVGAGTVTEVAQVAAVKAAGGEFIISPNTDPAVIKATKQQGLISIPGFFTPSEAFAAMAAGADYLKLFPAGPLGVGFIKDLKAVIAKPILAVGGVDANNIGDFLKVCPGVGIGSAIYKPGKTLEQLSVDIELLLKNI